MPTKTQPLWESNINLKKSFFDFNISVSAAPDVLDFPSRRLTQIMARRIYASTRVVQMEIERAGVMRRTVEQKTNRRNDFFITPPV